MNYKNNDTDLREALKRKYSDTPHLPADFMASMKQKMEQGGAAGGSSVGPGGKTTGSKKHPTLAMGSSSGMPPNSNRYRCNYDA